MSHLSQGLLNYKLKCEYRNVYFDHNGNYVFGDMCGHNRKDNDFGFCSLHKDNAYFAIKKLYEIKNLPPQ
jgi:hypothetical protein